MRTRCYCAALAAAAAVLPTSGPAFGHGLHRVQAVDPAPAADPGYRL